MTRDRMPEAQELGRKALKDDKIVHAATCRPKKHGPHMFDVKIMTPFASVAYAVFETRKTGKPLDLAQWPVEPPEKQSVIVSADPVSVFISMGPLRPDFFRSIPPLA